MQPNLPIELKPSLWRTCRAVANRRRLELLHSLFRDGPQTVQSLASQARLPEPVASQYLRLLQARGLIQGQRIGRHVLYAAQPDPAVPSAAPLLQALRGVLGSRSVKWDDILFALTGFTHPRRLLILKALDRGPLREAALRRATGISAPALSRHLDKLRRRRLVVPRDERIALAPGGTNLKRVLLRLAQSR